MPVTIDITKDWYYRQGVEKGIETDRIETAEKLFKNGFDISIAQKITDLPKDKLEDIQRSLAKK